MPTVWSRVVADRAAAEALRPARLLVKSNRRFQRPYLAAVVFTFFTYGVIENLLNDTPRSQPRPTLPRSLLR